MSDEHDKRRDQRIKQPYVIKFRELNDDQGAWDAVTPINISKSGICFYTTNQFKPGTDLLMLVSNPLLREERHYISTVLRSERSKKLTMLFETVVTIEAMEEETRKAFYRAIEEFITKNEDK